MMLICQIIIRDIPDHSGQKMSGGLSMKAKSQFELFLDDEVGKMKGISYPVRAGLLRRLFIKNMDCRKMHPNPNDEFCFPDIGPNYEIISG